MILVGISAVEESVVSISGIQGRISERIDVGLIFILHLD